MDGSFLWGWIRHPNPFERRASFHVGAPSRAHLNQLFPSPVNNPQYVAPADLSRFDSVIAELHRWEDVRYGGFPDATASVARSIGMVRAGVRSSKKRKVYDFGLHEIDDLFTAMFAASSINPSFVGGGYTHTALPRLYATE